MDFSNYSRTVPKVSFSSKELELYIKNKIEERILAKKDKNYALADHIRDELLAKNIIIKDTKEGTTYEIKD